MYINWEVRLIYLASPRTASVATSDALMSQCGFAKFRGHHDGLEKAGTLFSTSTRKEWTTITTVRNHWDTAVSWMFWGRKTPPWTVRDFEKGLSIAKDWIAYDQFFNFHLGQADIIWRYETLPTCMAETLSSCGLTIPVMGHKNISNGRDSREYHQYYVPETQQYIADRYADEIQRLGYSF